jgi:hypothetical protein
LTKYIKYNVCRLAVRYVLYIYIYDISRLRVKLILLVCAFVGILINIK